MLRLLVHQNSPQPLSVDLLPAINVGLELSVVRGRDQNKAEWMVGGEGLAATKASVETRFRTTLHYPMPPGQ